MELIESIMTKNPCYTAGRKITVKGLMLHSVGCPQPSAQAFIKNWNNPNYKSACVHAFIDGNTGIAYQTLPWNHRGWHGGGASNNTHIGVEMCEPACIEYVSGSKFTCKNVAAAKACVDRTYKTAVELFAMLCKKFNLNPLKDIVSHREGHALGIATNHGDPEHLWKGVGLSYTMDGFRNDVKKKMNNEEDEEMTSEEKTKFNNLVDIVGKLRTELDAVKSENEILKKAIGWNSDNKEEPALYAYNDNNIKKFISEDGNDIISKLISDGKLSVDENGAFAPLSRTALRLLIIQNR